MNDLFFNFSLILVFYFDVLLILLNLPEFAFKSSCLPDIIGCTTKYTTWSSHGGGQMIYIDRHGIDCGGNGHVLTMFHLQRIGENIRYQYTCCNFRSASYCSNQRKYTGRKVRKDIKYYRRIHYRVMYTVSPLQS